MKKYSCGHKPKKIFLKKTDIVLYMIYKQWKESDSNLCFDCWNKKRRKAFLELSSKVLKKGRKRKDNDVPLTHPRIG